MLNQDLDVGSAGRSCWLSIKSDTAEIADFDIEK
jgi:hypothetical protein